MTAHINPTSGDLLAALAKRYPQGQYALLQQVANGTGAKASRWADAIAMSLWPSRGLEVHGFELKVYRGDWLRELKQPEKAEAIAPFCHRWYIVTPQGLVLDGELPPAWGLLELKGGKLFTAREAPLNEPKPLTVPVVAAILRRASETMVPKSALEQLAQERAEALIESLRTSETLEVEGLRKLRESVRAFEAASGVKLDTYSGGDVGKEFRRFLEADRLRPMDRLHWQRNELRSMVEQIDRILEKAKQGEERVA